MFPALKSAGDPVNARAHIEPGTGTQTFVGYFAVGLGIIFTWGIMLLALPIGLLVDYFNRKKQMAVLRGSGLEVGPDQFPALHACAADYAQRLGMKTPPAIYIVESNVINAAATRIGSRNFIILVDDAVDACLRTGDPQTLAFLLGHEMAHHALGHTGLVRRALAQTNKKLSRLDEFSCDAVAGQLLGDRQAAARALTVLLTGPQLMRFVNFVALNQQAAEVAADKDSVKAERQLRLTHPLLLRRIQRFL